LENQGLKRAIHLSGHGGQDHYYDDDHYHYYYYYYDHYHCYYYYYDHYHYYYYSTIVCLLPLSLPMVYGRMVLTGEKMVA